jgi:DNA primase
MASRHERPRWDIGDVLAHTDLSVLLDELTTSATRFGPGRRWHCPMPEHADERPSVTMFRDHRGHERWRCWSGNHRGDAVDLVMAVTHRERAEAIDWLATRAGMYPDRPLPAVRPKRVEPAAAPARVMDPLVARYVDACAHVLDTAGGKAVRDWLNDRGLTDDTIATNRVGADPGRRQMRRERGLPYGAAPAATFAVFDAAGNLAYVQARYLDPDETGRKYDNPAAALAPHPRLAFTRAPAHTEGPLVVCEGMPDALVAAQAGYRSVGLLGAHTPDEGVAAQLAAHASRSGEGLALVCDPDPAGRRVADTLVPLLSAHAIEPVVVTPPGGLDLNAWALADPTWASVLAGQLGVEPARPADLAVGIDL